jgi:hypothetical protein
MYSMQDYKLYKASQNTKQLIGSNQTPVQHELMRTSIPDYTLAEAVRIPVHILLVRIVAVAVGNDGLAASDAFACPNQVVVTASLLAWIYFVCSGEHSIQRWRTVRDRQLRRTLQ